MRIVGIQFGLCEANQRDYDPIDLRFSISSAVVDKITVIARRPFPWRRFNDNPRAAKRETASV